MINKDEDEEEIKKNRVGACKIGYSRRVTHPVFNTVRLGLTCVALFKTEFREG